MRCEAGPWSERPCGNSVRGLCGDHLRRITCAGTVRGPLREDLWVGMEYRHLLAGRALDWPRPRGELHVDMEW